MKTFEEAMEEMVIGTPATGVDLAKLKKAQDASERCLSLAKEMHASPLTRDFIISCASRLISEHPDHPNVSDEQVVRMFIEDVFMNGVLIGIAMESHE